jgi:hypothetical protein
MRWGVDGVPLDGVDGVVAVEGVDAVEPVEVDEQSGGSVCTQIYCRAIGLQLWRSLETGG